ncbi:MAG TPA: RteC domain-containing protein [Petrimonas sp.]|nr:RteC domain-containing protein [Petrimonas sp.]
MNRIYQISKELTSLVHEKESQISDIIRDVSLIISILENGFTKLKEVVSTFIFPSKIDEITFFKEIKPQLFSKLIYFRKIYQIELNRPISNYDTIKFYLEKEHEQINLFFNKNAEFIQYYRSGQTTLDEYYFLRGRHEIELNLESFYFERDPNFSTNFDFKLAKLLANDMLAAYLNYQLSKIKYQEENNIFQNESKLPYAKWSDKKTALGEIIYGIYEEKSINAGDIEIKALADIFGKMFHVDLSDIYHIFLEIRSRKGNRTAYLNRLISALNRRMDEADSK